MSRHTFDPKRCLTWDLKITGPISAILGVSVAIVKP